MGRKSKFSKEMKIKTCEKYKKGNSSFSSISKEVGCSCETMRQWYMTYCIHGNKAFEVNNTNQTYSNEFKYSIIEAYLSGKFSMLEISAKHMISVYVVSQQQFSFYISKSLQNQVFHPLL